MGVMDFLKQFIDVIQWTESSDGTLAWRYPMQDMEIQNGAKLTVRESQQALIVNEGQMADLFGPGLHTLSTKNMPVLTNLMNWDKMFESPFKTDVYFFSTRLQLNQGWGTPNPITFRDKEYGPIRMRAHGMYSYKIADPKLFHKNVSGTREEYTASELGGQMLGVLVPAIASFLGSSEVPFIDMAANQMKFSQALKESLTDEFAAYGLALDAFTVQGLTLPDELQKKFDERASMNMIGDLRSYAQFQAAQSIPLAAQNESGIAGLGAGIGAGAAIGQMMGGVLGAGVGGGAAAAAQEDPIQTIEKLHKLAQQGIISQPEFEAKKAELLKKIS